MSTPIYWNDFMNFYNNKKKYYSEIVKHLNIPEGQENYSSVYFDGGYGYNAFMQRTHLVNTSLSKLSGTCLDVGSGDGFWSWLLAEWYDVTGIDPLKGPVELSNAVKNVLPEHIKNNTNFIVGDALTHKPKKKYDVTFLRAPSFFNYPPRTDITIDELENILDLDLKNIEQVWLNDGFGRTAVDKKLTDYKKYFNNDSPKDRELKYYAQYCNNFEKYLQQMISITNKMIYFEMSSREDFWGKFIGSTYNHDPEEIKRVFSKYGTCNVKFDGGYIMAELFLQ